MPAQTHDFEDRLESGLRSYLDPHAVGTIPAWRMPDRAPFRSRILAGAGAVLAVKIVTGAAVVAVAAGATTGIVVTHSVNPADWARSAQQQAQSTPNPQHSRPSPTASSPQLPPIPSGQPVISPAPLPSVSAPPLPTVSAPPLPAPTPSTPALP